MPSVQHTQTQNVNELCMPEPILSDWEKSNHLFGLHSLEIEVYILRHGRSLAMEADLIVSDPINGLRPEFGLAPMGIDEVRHTMEAAKAAGILDQNTIIVSSPFLRTVESAAIAAEILGVDSIQTDDRLRERGFGERELQRASSGYDEVHKLDYLDPRHTTFGVESLCATQDRASSFFAEMNQTLPLKHPHTRPLRLLAVLHGDIGFVSSLAFAKTAAEDTSAAARLKTAELRKLEL